MDNKETFKVKVKNIKQEVEEIKSFILVNQNGNALPAFSAGAHIDIHTPSGIIRQYSLCNGPDEKDHYMLAIKKEPESRGGSKFMHEVVQEGDVLTISAPRNNFKLKDDADKYLLLAGGIGVTPILSMAKQLLAEGKSFEFHYFTRSKALTAFQNYLFGNSIKDFIHFQYALEPDDLSAYLRKLLGKRPENGHLYLCGPRPFMDLVEQTASATWKADSVHLEYFSAESTSLSGSETAFEVKLAKSGQSFVVPEGKTIIEVLAENGFPTDTSCEQGVCGTCLTGVLEGIPDHKCAYLMDDEKDAGDKIMICVSGAKTKTLVLDL